MDPGFRRESDPVAVLLRAGRPSGRWSTRNGPRRTGATLTRLQRCHPKRFERGKPLGTSRPAPPREPSQGARLVSVRTRFSPKRQESPSVQEMLECRESPLAQQMGTVSVKN